MTDRRSGWCVLLGMALAACGGSSAKKQTTPASSGSVSYEKLGDDQAMPVTGEQPPAAADETEQVYDPNLPHPPTQDLPPAKRAALVKEQLAHADAALRAGDTDGMLRAANAALDVDETSVEAMIMLAHGNYLKGYDDKAEAILNLARKQRAGDAHPVLWMLLGLVYDRTHREDQALAAYERATKLEPDYVAALTNRGAIYLSRKRYGDAITVLEQVVRLAPKSARAHSHLGAAYRGRSAEAGQPRDALLKRAEKELRVAVETDPGYAPAYFNLGILYLDADPFPGLDALARLTQAQRYLSEYKKTAGASPSPAADDYLAAAQKGIEREQKLLERKKKKAQQSGGTE